MSFYDYEGNSDGDYEEYYDEYMALSRHKKSDKVKWIITAVAFFLIFVLIGSLFAILLRSTGDKKETEQTAKVQTFVLAFDDEEKRTSYSEDKQVWADNGIVFTNLKGSGSGVKDYYDPIRLYAHSTVEIEREDMTEIVFYCMGSTHARNLQDTLETLDDIAVSVRDFEVTVVFDKTVDTFEVANLVGQVQLSQIAVKAYAPVLAEDETPDEENESEQDGGMLASPDETASETSPVSLAVRMLSTEEYDDYGIMPLAESAYTVTATVKDTSGSSIESVQGVTFSLKWASTNSAAVSDYVTMTTTETTATLTCIKAFSTQIILTVASQLDPTKTATVTLDYAKRLSGGTAKFLTGGTSTAISTTSKTISAAFPSSYASGAITPLTGGDWSTDKSLQWFEGGTYDAAGTTDNSVSYYVVTITPSEAFKSAYSNHKQSSANSMLNSFTMDSHGGTGYNMAATINYFYMKLLGMANGNDGTLSSAGIYRAMSLALFETTNQFTVSVTVTPKYGEVQTYKYVLNVSTDAPNVGSVSTNQSAFIF